MIKSLKVQAGDNVAMEVYGKYYAPEADAGPSAVAAAIGSSFINAFNIPAGPEGAALTDFFTDLFATGSVFGTNGNTDNVYGYLNYQLYDKNFAPVDMGFIALTEVALEDGTDIPHEYLSLKVPITKDGYIYIYLSNESDKICEVYFDDFKITHEKLVPDLAHSTNTIAYRYGFNGKEKDQSGELGMNHYDYGFRIYNPAIARFLSVDPLTKSYPMLTPYQFASNRPIDGIDLDGLELLDYKSMWDIESVTLPVLGTYYSGTPVTSHTTTPLYYRKNNMSIGNPVFGRSINGELLPPRIVKEYIYDPTRNIFKEETFNINSADRTRDKIKEYYKTNKKIKTAGRSLILVRALKKISIFGYEWINAEKDGAVHDISVNSGAVTIALNLVYKALNNTSETKLKELYVDFDKSQEELVKDLTSYVVDYSVIDNDNKEYVDYIKTTGNKILDSYKGKKNQKRKSTKGTKINSQ